MERQFLTIEIAPPTVRNAKLFISQGDVGRELGIKVVQNGLALDCTGYTAMLYVYKSDGNVYTKTCDIAGNQITWETGEQESAAAGRSLCEIRITKASENIGTANFFEMVEPSPDYLGPQSDSEIEGLEAQVEALVEAAAGPYVEASEEFSRVAEGFAKGTQSGEPVDSESEYYHDNALYYKDQAGLSAQSAALSETNAGLSEAAAEAARDLAEQYKDQAFSGTPAGYEDLVKTVKNIINAFPEFDASIGEYTNSSINSWLKAVRTGLEYGIRVPLSAAITLTKLGANASIAIPTLAVGTVSGVDPYFGKGPFFWVEVNGYVDADGTPHVTAIKGDNNFSRTEAQTWILTPVIYWKVTNDGTNQEIWISDTKLSGYNYQPHAKLPDGTVRPYMLYAKYVCGYKAGGIGGGFANTKSGLQPWTNSGTNAAGASCTPMSHNGAISIFDTANTGYSCRSVADDWYLKIMFMMKYATKNSQAYFPQCSSYYYEYPITVAEDNVTRAIISKSNANNLVIGSSVVVKAGDQNAAAPSYKILGIEAYDSNNSIVNLDMGSARYSPTTSMKLFTLPWFTGACDMLETDGVLASGAKYPCMLQGIEFGLGATEIIGDVIASSDGSTGWIPYVNHDSKKEATSVTADYVSTGASLPVDSAESWKYPKALDNTAEGLLFGTETGGSQSTGICDGHYASKQSTVGTREWRALGALANGGVAGVSYGAATYELGAAHWAFSGRPSANGRAG